MTSPPLSSSLGGDHETVVDEELLSMVCGSGSQLGRPESPSNPFSLDDFPLLIQANHKTGMNKRIISLNEVELLLQTIYQI